MLDRFRAVLDQPLQADRTPADPTRVSRPTLSPLVGTLGVVGGALDFFPRGEFFIGVIVITCFVFSDLVDGYMARTMGVSSKWGAFLDSTLDRFGDAAVFAGLAIWFFRGGDDQLLAYVALWALVMGSVTSYARARAESLGMTAKGGIAERSDRLVSVLVMAGLSDIFDLPILLDDHAVGACGGEHGHRRPADAHGAQAGARRPDAAVLSSSSESAPARDGWSTIAFRMAWAVTRHSPEPVPARLSRASPTGCGGNAAPAFSSWRPTCVAPRPTHDRRPARNCPGRRCGRTFATGMRCSGCRRGRTHASSTRSSRRARTGCGTGSTGAAARSSRCRTWPTGISPAHGRASTGMPVSTVAERLQPDVAVTTGSSRYREALGMEVIAADRGRATR